MYGMRRKRPTQLDVLPNLRKRSATSCALTVAIRLLPVAAMAT